MRPFRLASIAAPLLLLVTACSDPATVEGSGAATTRPDRAALEERGRSIAAEFRTQLKGELLEALADGPQHAIGVCAVRAPEIADELSVDGVEVGRATHRPRNPANAATGWLAPLVEEYVETNGEDGPRLVELPGGRVGWVEPLLVGPPCLTCHGTDVAPELLDEIRAIYPGDRATGFAEGDFRGLLWVTLPAGA